jgi:hypothetical protein
MTERPVKVAIFTPYLTDRAPDYGTWAYEAAEIPDKFKTKKRQVYLEFRFSNGGKRNVDAKIADLVIAGCTPAGEKEVSNLCKSGTIVARYSKYYGKPSGHTGKKPEQSGYSLDLVKRSNYVEALLQNDWFLDGLVEREERKIRNAISGLNLGSWEPIIITPYLAEALKVKRGKQK